MPKHQSIYINNILTPQGRFSFPHLSKPDSKGEYADDKYKVQLLIPKDGADLSALKKAISECAKQAWPKRQLKMSDLAHLPIRDGDDKPDLDGYPGNYFISAKTKKKPRCIDARAGDLDHDEVEGGDYGRLKVTVMSYEQAGKPGITFLLEVVQKTKDGERFGGGGASTDDMALGDEDGIDMDAEPGDDDELI